MWLIVWGFLKEIPFKVWAVIGLTLLLFGTFYYLKSGWEASEQKLQTEQQERKRAEDKSEGLKILVNTANIAQEIENDKRITNQKSANSNASNIRYANSRNVDSNQRSNSFRSAKEQFCLEYPGDSLCQN